MPTYRNPVIPGFHPDPSVCRVGEDFYLVTSSFEYFPGIPLYHSRDLTHWEQIGHCLDRSSQLDLDGCAAGGGVWAPTIRWHRGRFYVTYTNDTTAGNYLISAADPRGPWSEPIRVAMEGIDPSLTFDGETAYLLTNQPAVDGTPGISMAEIDVHSGDLVTPIRLIWHGTGAKMTEGPHLYRIGEWYYLLVAEGGTQFTHQAALARARSPWGPYEPCPHNPVLTNVNSVGEVHCTGHGDLVADASGNWWMVHLGIRIARKYMSHLGRETFLAPVSWDDDAWPVVNDGAWVDTAIEGPLPPAYPVPSEPGFEDFSRAGLAPHWNTLRAPAADAFSFDARPGWLAIRGNRHTLADRATPAFLARRQTSFDCVIETELDFLPTTESDEAGLAILLSNEFHYRFSCRRRSGRRVLMLDKRADDFRQTTEVPLATSGPITLRVTADRERYVFSYAEGAGPLRQVATASTRFLACEVLGRGFTGTFCGIYATGNGQAADTSAYFKRFVLRPVSAP